MPRYEMVIELDSGENEIKMLNDHLEMLNQFRLNIAKGYRVCVHRTEE